jgi:hypothetical protein
MPGKASLTESLISSFDEAVGAEPVAVSIPAPSGAPAGAARRTEGSAAGAESTAGAAPAGPWAIADIVWEPIVDNLDSIAPTIGFSGSSTRGGITLKAGEFGRTDSSPSLTAITITQASGAFNVTATYSLVTKWDTRKGTGPSGQVNIPDENAAGLTAANYKTAVSDLTPDLSDEGGRPPRTKFWAQDLTERHEKVHAADHQKTGKDGLKAALTWLGTQTASTQAEVETHLRTLQTKIVQYILANGAGSVGELHAYGDGASLYQARADAIKKKGDGGGYP